MKRKRLGVGEEGLGKRGNVGAATVRLDGGDGTGRVAGGRDWGQGGERVRIGEGRRRGRRAVGKLLKSEDLQGFGQHRGWAVLVVAVVAVEKDSWV